MLSASDEQAATAYNYLESAVESMASEISLLHELTNTIRRASKKANEVRAASSFQIRDEEGNDLEEPLKSHFAANIQDHFPGISDIIRLRLAKTMVLRRKRILYKRFRYSQAPIRISMYS